VKGTINADQSDVHNIAVQRLAFFTGRGSSAIAIRQVQPEYMP